MTWAKLPNVIGSSWRRKGIEAIWEYTQVFFVLGFNET